MKNLSKNEMNAVKGGTIQIYVSPVLLAPTECAGKKQDQMNAILEGRY